MTAAHPPSLHLIPATPERTAKPCSTPGDDHEGPVRLYPCGLRCDGHAPGPAITRVPDLSRHGAGAGNERSSR